MLTPNHPEDERLSAFAARDDDALADAALASHVSSCIRCTGVITELGALRASLAELPDVAPPRPLRLLPPVADERATGAAGWVRRLFAPALTAGAAIAMVGLVGTAGPLFGGMASSGSPTFQDAGSELQEAGEEPAASLAQVRSSGGGYEDVDGGAPAAADESAAATDDVPRPTGEGSGAGEAAGNGGDDAGERLAQLPAERSIWPMLLFTGIALMVAAALLRWILVPRAG